MKISTKQVKKTKVVDDGTKDVTIYETIDGKKFDNKKEAEKHEDNIIKDRKFKDKYKLKTIELDEFYELVYVEELSEENKKELCEYFYRLNRNELAQGWNFIHTDYSGDYTYTYCYSLAYMVETREKELNMIKDLCV